MSTWELIRAASALLDFFETNGIFGEGNFNSPTEAEAAEHLDSLRSALAYFEMVRANNLQAFKDEAARSSEIPRGNH